MLNSDRADVFGLKNRLDNHRKKQLYRKRRIVSSPQSARVVIDGKSLLAFCNNDYLGLANHPTISEAMCTAVAKYGTGSGASHLIMGHSQAHHELEEALALFTGRERALLFSTGYMANLGTILALLNRYDAIFEDRLNHASLVDAGLMSKANFHRYRHSDITHLNQQIQQSTAQKKLIVSDGVFSMDGDLASIRELAKIAQQQNAWLMVDDAHGFGVLGDNGGGIAELYQMNQIDIPILMGTLGKAFGVSGAFIAGSKDLIETLIQFSRTYIYTTAMPPALAEAALVSLQLVQKESWRRDKLKRLIRYFRKGCLDRKISLTASETPIQPIIVGSAKAVLQISAKMEQLGILVIPIRPPTVAVNSCRLRITLNVHHDYAMIDQLLDTLIMALMETNKLTNQPNTCIPLS